MTATQLAPPYPIWTDKNGDPLDNGYLYFGVQGQNPETNPVQVYYDSALTQPAAQPLRTLSGYVMRNGSPALIYANSAFSVTVRNKKNELVVYLSSFKWVVGDINTSQLIGQLDADRIDFTQAGSGAVLQTVQDKLEESVSVLDFGAVGDGVTDDTAAFTNAVATGKVVLIPEAAGSYQVTGTFSGNTFVSLGGVDPTNNSTIESSLMGMAYNTSVNDTNISFIPSGAVKSFSIKGHNEGAMNLWGGDSTGVANPSTGATGTGITLYGREHPTYPEDIKLRSKNERPLWFKSSSTVSFGSPNKVGYWSMEDYSLIDVDVFQSTALSANAPFLRVDINTNEMEIGSSTSGEKYEIDNRNDGSYLQINGGISQATGASLRLYGGTTSGASTDAGLIFYGDGTQELRFRQDISDWDFKGNTTSNISDEREKENIRSLTDVERACAADCKGLVKAFTYTRIGNNNGERIGVIAQEVIQTFNNHGLTATDYAIVTYDQEEDRYRVSYNDFFAFVISAL